MEKYISYSTDEKWGEGFVFVGTEYELAAELVKIERDCGWQSGATESLGYESVSVDDIDCNNAQDVIEACELAVKLGWYSIDDVMVFTKAAEKFLD